MSEAFRQIRSTCIRRYDDDHLIYYFSHADFPGLCAKPFSFSSLGERVCGFFYAYPDAPDKKENDLVLFCHGLGGGHRSYLREIERLCRAGYTVAAYDNIGCFASGGESILGIAASVPTVDDFFSYLKESEKPFARVLIIGHSWGGFTAGASLSRHPEIQKAVLLSPFDTVEDGIRAVVGQNEEDAVAQILAEETKNFPLGKELSVSSSLEKADIPALIIASEDDGTIPVNLGIEAIRSRTAAKRTSFLLTNKKGHNPNYTEAAVSLMGKVFSGYFAAQQDGSLGTWEEKKAYMSRQDWLSITEQDETVWQTILAFFE